MGQGKPVRRAELLPLSHHAKKAPVGACQGAHQWFRCAPEPSALQRRVLVFEWVVSMRCQPVHNSGRLVPSTGWSGVLDG